MNKFIFSAVSSSMLIGLFGTPVLAQETTGGATYFVTSPVPEEAKSYARYAMNSHVGNFYQNPDPAIEANAASSVSLGDGFVEYIQDENGTLRPGTTYCFPVYNGDQMLFMITASNVDGVWSSTSYAVSSNGNASRWTALQDNPGTYLYYANPKKYIEDFQKVDDSASVDPDAVTVQLYPATDDRNITSYRLYNPNSGEHFYTQDVNEWKTLASLGWQKEGAGWFSPLAGEAVYRLYNPNSGEHHYTTDQNEQSTLASLGWKEEGVSFFSDEEQKVPVYRLFNPKAANAGSHHYTTSKAEADALADAGWSYEGIGWYADLAGWTEQGK